MVLGSLEGFGVAGFSLGTRFLEDRGFSVIPAADLLLIALVQREVFVVTGGRSGKREGTAPGVLVPPTKCCEHILCERLSGINNLKSLPLAFLFTATVHLCLSSGFSGNL